MWHIKELIALTQLTGKVNAYGNDQTDEFSIDWNGKRIGIFKSWAIPVIPFLDFDNIDVLVKLWPRIIKLAETMSFWQALAMLSRNKSEAGELAVSISETFKEWRSFCLKNPNHLQRSLERARLNSWILDKELTWIFNEEKLSESLPVRIQQLVNRLELSFSLLSPFYHLEALAGDSRWLYGEEKPDQSFSDSGKLDVVALLLPAALRSHIVADRLDWHGLSWEKIQQTTRVMLSDPTYCKILLNISRLAGIPPQHVVFAVNSLEWIPTRVGGKKNDPISINAALAQLEKIFTKDEAGSQAKSAATVLSNINALIRFLNWVPLIEGEANFRGRNWTYSSVCDTANTLFATITDNPEVWKSDFRSTFVEVLQPQMINLDATSAKGRFLLQLIGEGRFKPIITPHSNLKWKTSMIKKINERSTHLETARTIWPQALVGDKTFGLSLASEILGADRIVSGFIVTSDEVESWLRIDPELWRSIVLLSRQRDLDQKALVAAQIQNKIKKTDIPEWLYDLINRRMKAFHGVKSWAVRSSSLEEGEARGIYASYLEVSGDDVVNAIRNCLASFFNKEAVMFRSANHAGDLPIFAILILPYKDGHGGVASQIRQGKSRRTAIGIGPSASTVTFNGQGVKVLDAATSQELSPLTVELKSLFGKLEYVFDHIQIEWVKADDSIQLLQMDFLSQQVVDPESFKPCDFTIEIKTLADILVIEQELKQRRGIAAIELGHDVRLDSFQGELCCLVAQFGQRIGEIRTSTVVAETSHFANICRHFGICLQQL